MARTRPLRSRRKIEAADHVPASVSIGPVGWNDLTKDEQVTLKRMNRGPYTALGRELAQRLMDLGLVQVRSHGIGISRIGRELVINALLEARQGEDNQP